MAIHPPEGSYNNPYFLESALAVDYSKIFLMTSTLVCLIP
jgi:hypothetical protein